MPSFRTAAANTSASIAALIDSFNAGDARAQELLIERLYRDLRRVAAAQLRSERRNHTLQPTALVNEAFARLIQQSALNVNNRVHLIAIASQLMRQVLVDHARTRLASKRGGARRQVTLDDAVLSEDPRNVDVLLLDSTLRRLTELDPRMAE